MLLLTPGDLFLYARRKIFQHILEHIQLINAIFEVVNKNVANAIWS